MHVTAYYAEGNTTTETKNLTLPDVTLQPGQARELDLRDAMKTRPEISDINLLFSYTGDYGDVLAATGSTDGTGNYVFPVMPQAVGPSGTKASIYWEVANGFDTMYTIFNPTGIPQELAAIVHYGASGEKFTLPLHLNEYASAMIDIGELIRTQQADQDQNVLPQDTHEGSLEVRPVTADPQDTATFVLAGGIYNPRKATCGQTCETCPGVSQWGVVPNSFTIPISQTSQAQFHIKMSWGYEYDVAQMTDWASWNTSIATVQTKGDSHPGLITGAGAGSTTITGQYVQSIPINLGQPICTSPPAPMPPCPIPDSWSGSASVNVLAITSISPSVIPIDGNDLQLTISGSGFGNSPTVNLPSGVSKVSQSCGSQCDSQIVITVNASNSATVGYGNISVTANGAMSNVKQISLDGPYSLLVISDIWGYCNGCTTTIFRDVQYQIKNFSNTNAGPTTICELPSLTGWNCTQNEPRKSARYCGSNPFDSYSGTFVDHWSLESDNFSPSGCGETSVVDPWYWSYTTPKTLLGTPSGSLLTNHITINNVTAPGGSLNGTTMPK